MGLLNEPKHAYPKSAPSNGSSLQSLTRHSQASSLRHGAQTLAAAGRHAAPPRGGDQAQGEGRIRGTPRVPTAEAPGPGARPRRPAAPPASAAAAACTAQPPCRQQVAAQARSEESAAPLRESAARAAAAGGGGGGAGAVAVAAKGVA